MEEIKSVLSGNGKILPLGVWDACSVLIPHIMCVLYVATEANC